MAITIVLSVAAVYFMEIILVMISFITDYGAGIAEAAQLTAYLLADGSTWGLITQNSIPEFLFTGLGIWFSWGYISRTNQTSVQSVDAQAATRMSLQATGSQNHD